MRKVVPTPGVLSTLMALVGEAAGHAVTAGKYGVVGRRREPGCGACEQRKALLVRAAVPLDPGHGRQAPGGLAARRPVFEVAGDAAHGWIPARFSSPWLAVPGFR